jgi:hypothetical protein
MDDVVKEQVYVLGESGPTPASETMLSQLGYKERSDLQQWIICNPEIIEPGLMILTDEYDRWADVNGRSVRDRLDILALGPDGRLVVLELKRDDAPDDIHLQAITYAAMVSRLTEEDLAGIHAGFVQRRGSQLTDDQALEAIRKHVDGELDPLLLRRPRLVLIARQFPRQVTSSAVWLNEMDIDVRLILVRVWSTPPGTVLTTSTYYPVPGTEEFTIVPARAEAAKATERATDRTRNTRAIVRIVESGVLADGAVLTLRPFELPAIREQLQAWAAEDPARGQAEWINDATRPLRWRYDQRQYAPSTLVKEIVERVAGRRPDSVWGPRWWVDNQGHDLYELASGEPVETSTR